MAFTLFAENTAITLCHSGAYLGFFYLTSYKLGRGSLVSLFVGDERDFCSFSWKIHGTRRK